MSLPLSFIVIFPHSGRVARHLLLALWEGRESIESP